MKKTVIVLIGILVAGIQLHSVSEPDLGSVSETTVLTMPISKMQEQIEAVFEAEGHAQQRVNKKLNVQTSSRSK